MPSGSIQRLLLLLLLLFLLLWVPLLVHGRGRTKRMRATSEKGFSAASPFVAKQDILGRLGRRGKPSQCLQGTGE